MKENYEEKSRANCQTCEFYDYDEFAEIYVCRANLDQDEAAVAYVLGRTRSCSYYRYNDEYGLVRKQN